MPQATFVYSDPMSRHILRDDHVMRPTRLRYTHDLLQAYGVFERTTLVSPRPATEEELRWFHTPDYIRAVRSISKGDRSNAERNGFSEQGDNPPYTGMYEAALLLTGGSLVAAELLVQGNADVAFNVAGGLHHAMPGQASGFCIFNDPVIAIEYLARQGLRPMYVDIDCHHGDGVQAAFYDSDKVLTVSMHESGRYLFPGTGEVHETGVGAGRGYSVNVPLAPYTQDDVFTGAFMEVIPPLARAFKPDVIVTQLGIDTHFDDPITHLQLTVEGHATLARELGKMAPKWLALGGGGYDMSAVARGWTLDFALMAGLNLPDEVPAGYAKTYGITHLRDGAAPAQDEATLLQTRRFAEDSVQRVREVIFPTHGIK